MFGLRMMTNMYVPDATGRDRPFVTDKELRDGKSKASPFRTACLNRTCYPRSRAHGPKPPSSERINTLHNGQWKCTGEWTSSGKSAKCLSHVRSESEGRATLKHMA